MLYINKNKEIVEDSNKFNYCEDIYLIYPLRIVLFRTKYYSSDIPIKRPNARIYSKEYKCHIQRFWNLDSAPKEYLLENGFKPKI